MRDTCYKELYLTIKQKSYQARNLWTGNIHIYCRAVGSGAVTTCFYNLGLSQLGFQHPTFRLWDKCSNQLCHRYGLVLCNVILSGFVLGHVKRGVKTICIQYQVLWKGHIISVKLMRSIILLHMAFASANKYLRFVSRGRIKNKMGSSSSG